MIAVLENDKSLAQLFLALGLFVVTAVPRAIRKRRKRCSATITVSGARQLG